MISRRGLLRGLLAAPVIIRTPGLLMPVKPLGDGVALNSMVHPSDSTLALKYSLLQTKWHAMLEVCGGDFSQGSLERHEMLLQLHHHERLLAESFRRVA